MTAGCRRRSFPRRACSTPSSLPSRSRSPYFPRGEITELVGAHGIFKSTVAIGACLSVATGRTWGGAPVEQGPAVFITMEDGERTLAMRVQAWLDGVPAGQERADAEETSGGGSCTSPANSPSPSP